MKELLNDLINSPKNAHYRESITAAAELLLDYDISKEAEIALRKVIGLTRMHSAAFCQRVAEEAYRLINI